MLVAINGSPTRYASPPDGAVTVALAALAPLDPWCNAYQGIIRTIVPRHLTRTGSSKIMIEWRWGELWRTSDWYEMGWHPDYSGNALTGEGWRAYQAALNPHARFWQHRYTPRRQP